ncbi:HDOD domain-containing protein [sulfur-oxidizing endosymbiont of Gigantopelta aegis]|uniref:HDOD domain-containing protein n=1 Tax=sulfur-oxidizing endosymbiont of Gigantopelta aegis TaxID=2794934 RepID=UPI0018DBB045|nr:HDOD domain-containing protein [sulfur-oxidizing endosymbiont of Gigantopelta aegis]
MADVAEIISYDPALTARLLKLVNSPFFGLVAKVDTITRAINLLGTQQVHDLVLATAVIDSFSGFDNDCFNIYDFWFNGVYCAVTARLLAYYCQDLDTQRSFVGGLLHNLGHLIMYQKIPEEALRAAELATEKNISLPISEREILSFDYAQLGAELMREWKLPESLQEITEFHIEPEKSDRFKIETAIVHIASAITQNALAQIPISEETLKVKPLCWELTGLSSDKMADIKTEVDQQAGAVMSILFKQKKS